MRFIIDRSMRLGQGVPGNMTPSAPQTVSSQFRSSQAERWLILTTIIILPLSNQLPSIVGMSVSFLIFAALTVYVLVNRSRVLGQVWQHPVFIAAYAFICVSILLEVSSPLSRYDDINRFAQMIGGAVCLAVICRDRSALVFGLYGYIAAALWVSLYLYLTSYGALQGVGTTGSFHQASQARAQAFSDMDLKANLNGLAFVCAQGAVVAFALAVAGPKQRRIPMLGVVLFCLVAAFLPMSRGAVVIGLVCFGTVLYAQGVRHGKTLIMASVLGLAIYVLVPDAVWSRMQFSTESRSGKMEGRAWIYTSVLNRLPEFIVAGVGAGNYWANWGFEKGLTREHDGVRVVYGAHNSLLQITLFWGLLGLMMFLWIVWCVYRSVPLRCGRDELSLALLGIIVSLSLWLMQSHAFYDKWYACGLGLFVGARHWIWPTGIVSTDEVSQTSSYARM